MGYNDRVDFSVLKGKTLDAISGAENGSGEIRFMADDGTEYLMYHSQDCCESVAVEDVIGDVRDLVGLEILEAEEVSGETPRWLGESNGYYSESVDFEQVNRRAA